jgi:uncharacterized protein YbbC (DUF1343 family)
MTGLDVLQAEDFARLKGKNVGIVANHSAINSQRVHMLDLMLKSGNVKIVAIFSPEHGFKGVMEQKVDNAVEEKTGLPIYSLYGETRRPKEEWLKDVDVLVFDIQDIGARFYTYISTMALCMEEAAKHDITFMVLDRPNPITGLKVDGPIQDRELLRRFISYFPMPIMHGMTVGELATMFNQEYGIQCNLEVVKMDGWKRVMYFDDTGLPWVNPSPNMRSVTQEILYPGVCLTEYSNISVGRGTDTPFEWIGAPWIKAEELTNELRSRNLPGIKFEPTTFTPNASKFKGEQCQGVRFVLTDRGSFLAVVTGIHILDAIYKLYPDTYEIDKAHGLVGKKKIIEMIKQRVPVNRIIADWQPELQSFITIRNQYILYTE